MISILFTGLLLPLASCYIYFTDLPFTNSEIRMDSELLGTWERDPKGPRDFSAKYRFTRRSDTVMDVWGESDNFLAVACRVGALRRRPCLPGFLRQKAAGESLSVD